jgi:WD40 repeat protein
VNSVAFSPDGTTLATGNANGNTIYLWDVSGTH